MPAAMCRGPTLQIGPQEQAKAARKSHGFFWSFLEIASIHCSFEVSSKGCQHFAFLDAARREEDLNISMHMLKFIHLLTGPNRLPSQ